MEKDRERLRSMILEGMASPLSEEPWDSEYFERLRERIRSAS